jgi:hypothetical protein
MIDSSPEPVIEASCDRGQAQGAHELGLVAIEDLPVIVKCLSHLGLPPALRRGRERSDSIHSRRSEKLKPVANAN